MVHPLVHPRGCASPTLRPALRLVKTQALSRADWLAVRQGGIGSSDAAAAVGLNPYQSQLALWLEKTGREAALSGALTDAPLSSQAAADDDQSPLYWGTLLEPIVAAHYTRRTGRRVRRINAVLQHPEHPWMLANIDREVLGASDVQLLECKTAGLQGAWLWRDGVPEYVQLQVQHQLAVTGKTAADVAVLLGGQELEIFRIERDEELIAQLITLERAFWGYVERDQQPPADGSDCADRALRALYPRDTGSTLDWRGDLVMGAVFSDLVAVREVLAAQAALEARLRQSIQQRMGDASRALFDGGEVSFRRGRDGTALDTARLQQEQPGIVRQYAVPRPGSRRFLVRT